MSDDCLFFSYWAIHVDKPYFDDVKDSIKAFKLQRNGFIGFCVTNYSRMEFDAIKTFAKTTESFLLEYYSGGEYHKEIGNFISKSFCVWTQKPEEFQTLLHTLPARNKLLFLDKKLRKKIPYKNYLYVKGENGKIVLTYSDPNDVISTKDHNLMMRVLRKLTK